MTPEKHAITEYGPLLTPGPLLECAPAVAELCTTASLHRSTPLSRSMPGLPHCQDPTADGRCECCRTAALPRSVVFFESAMPVLITFKSSSIVLTQVKNQATHDLSKEPRAFFGFLWLRVYGLSRTPRTTGISQRALEGCHTSSLHGTAFSPRRRRPSALESTWSRPETESRPKS